MLRLAEVYICFVFNPFKILNFDNIDVFVCYIKQIMKVFIRAIVKIFLMGKNGINFSPCGMGNSICHRMKIVLLLDE